MLCTSPFFANGTVTGQGDSFVANVPRPLPTLAALGIVQVACGESHNAALTIHGQVFTWGRGKYGALGLGTFDSSSWPQHVAALQEPACQVTTPSLACLQLLVCNCLSATACLQLLDNVMLISAVHIPSLGWLPCRLLLASAHHEALLQCGVMLAIHAQNSDSNEHMS